LRSISVVRSTVAKAKGPISSLRRYLERIRGRIAARPVPFRVLFPESIPSCEASWEVASTAVPAGADVIVILG
jgi:hypothetical protein